jgi:hypothetical protein
VKQPFPANGVLYLSISESQGCGAQEELGHLSQLLDEVQQANFTL